MVEKVFSKFQKKLTKDKVIPIHGQQNWVLDMAYFETNFLSNHNSFFLQTSMVL